jgi:hypothetical protein
MPNNQLTPSSTRRKLTHHYNHKIMMKHLSEWTTGLLLFLVAIPPLLGSPTFTTQPVDFSVSLGANITNTVKAGSALPITYQWLFNGEHLDGGTSRILLLTNIALSNAGLYALVATDSLGSVTSRVVTLTVDPSFTKITSQNIVTNNAGGAAAIWVDINADGQLDLFVTGGSRRMKSSLIMGVAPLPD